MSAFAVEDVVVGHPRFRAAGAAASWLWTVSGAWSTKEGTHGFVPMMTVLAFGTKAQAEKLVEVELWERAEGGYRFLRWRDGKGSTETVDEERRRKEREKKQRYRANRRRVSTTEGDGTVDGPVDMSTDVHRMSTDVHQPLDTASSLEVPPLSPPQGKAQPAAAPTTPAEKPKRKAPARLLPASWQPIERHRDFAAKNALDLPDEVSRFREYHGFKGTLGVDWDRGFDTWLRNAVKFRTETAARQQPAPAKQPVDWMNPR